MIYYDDGSGRLPTAAVSVGDIFVRKWGIDGRPLLRYRWDNNGVSEDLGWQVLCDVGGCNNLSAWHVGGKGVCEEHKRNSKGLYILYRHWNDSGDLLYVGRTNDPPKRACGHRSLSDFWRDVVDGGSTTYERFMNHEDLCAAEILAIETEEPRYNKNHNKRFITAGYQELP